VLTLASFGASPAPFREYLAAEDPLLFASASRQGFSGPAWLDYDRNVYLAPEQLPAAQYLAFLDARRAFGPESITSPPPQPMPLVSIHPDVPALLGAATPAASSLEVAGGLDGRVLLNPPTLPPEYSSEVLGASGIEVAVRPDGTVISSRLLDSSGSRQADQDALGIARRLRFKPAGSPADVETASLAWGKLLFHWHALDLVSTNGLRR
jgi:TonB family protein